MNHFCGNRAEYSTPQRTETSGPHYNLISLNFASHLVDCFSDETEPRAGFEFYLRVTAEANRVAECFFRVVDSTCHVRTNRHYGRDVGGIERSLVLHIQQNDLGTRTSISERHRMRRRSIRAGGTIDRNESARGSGGYGSPRLARSRSSLSPATPS
jgi:hypothetical protein